jgi:hypothetical protein
VANERMGRAVPDENLDVCTYVLFWFKLQIIRRIPEVNGLYLHRNFHPAQYFTCGCTNSWFVVLISVDKGSLIGRYHPQWQPSSASYSMCVCGCFSVYSTKIVGVHISLMNVI